MLNLAPKSFPPLSVMLDDLGNPKPAAIAKTLGVSRRTVDRWIADDSAPVAVLMCIFWLTRWGQSQVYCQAVNDARIKASLAGALERENTTLNQRIQKLARISDFGCANDPGVSLSGPGSMASPPSHEYMSWPIRVTIPDAGRRPRFAHPTSEHPSMSASRL